MEFVTKYGKKNRKSTNIGSRMKNKYQMYIDKDGKETLEIVGQTDVYEEIQQYEPMVNIQNILARFNAGDESALDAARSFYADVSELPNNMQDVLNINLRGKEVFDSLPTEYKEIYGNDYQRFLVQPEKLVDYLNAKENVVVDSEVNVDGEQE